MPTRSKYGIPVEFTKPPQTKAAKKDAAAKKKAAKAEKDAQRAKEEEEEEERLRAAEMDPEEQKAAEARAREAEERKDAAKRLQAAKSKAQKAASKNEWVDAVRHYSECVELEPDDYLNWSNRAAAHRQVGLFEEMLVDATKATELKPDFVKGWWRIGQANLALEKFDEAEEALRHGLSLDPENENCMKCLESVETAKAEEEGDDFDILLKQLKALDPTQLRERALGGGLLQDKVDEAESREDPKEAMVGLIIAHKYLVDLIEADLQGLDLDQLRARALEEGLDEDCVDRNACLDEPQAALRAAIVVHLSNDLVGAATTVQDEAEYEDVPDDEEEEGGGIDIEVVTFDMDETALRLAEGDIFLAGAYIDDQYGELVLPSGTRLGNRSLHKYYRQRARPNRELAIAARTGNLHMRVQAKLAQRQGWKTANGQLMKSAAFSKGSSNALAAQAMRRANEADNKAMRAIVHHWGGGGGGSHYHMCGGKQYNKGNKVKGVILRHSRQGAKLQAARNKANRGNRSVACLK